MNTPHYSRDYCPIRPGNRSESVASSKLFMIVAAAPQLELVRSSQAKGAARATNEHDPERGVPRGGVAPTMLWHDRRQTHSTSPMIMAPPSLSSSPGAITQPVNCRLSAADIVSETGFRVICSAASPCADFLPLLSARAFDSPVGEGGCETALKEIRR